ncbi:hypothetical protein Gasu2_31780 [Galdieria sulphuraria]|nr:hypothetical protein Gasu2_31780 [Galdieria sulphuraria]
MGMTFIGPSFQSLTGTRLKKKLPRHYSCYATIGGCFAKWERAQLENPSVSQTEGEEEIVEHTKWEQYLQEKGSPECKQCSGTGEIPCPACEGKGYFVIELFNVTSSNQCQVCRGYRKAPCPTCKEYIYRAVNDWDKKNSIN